MQHHPLYDRERLVVDRLLQATTPTSQDIVDAARLLTRFDGFPGHQDLTSDIIKAARSWGCQDRDDLNSRARVVWQRGFRPGLSDDEVGSGADVGPVEQAASA
jgi:hypothetical protein